MLGFSLQERQGATEEGPEKVNEGIGTFLSCGKDNKPGTGCPERMWSLRSYKYSKAAWMWS